ncbi:MAG: GGDEF domain-containing protein [Desulfohalobiaceae bacterium]
MSQQVPKEIVLALGLSPNEQYRLQMQLGTRPRLLNYDTQSSKAVHQALDTDPLLVLIPWRVWKNLPQSKEELSLQEDDSRLLLIQPQQEDLELGSSQLLSQCVLGIISPDQDSSELNKALEQAREFRQQQKSLQQMKQEILLERELLHRKNSQLQFLNHFMHQVSQNLELEQILSQAVKNLSSFVPLQQTGIIFWEQLDQPENNACMVLDQDLSQPDQELWRSHLLQKTREQLGYNLPQPKERLLPWQLGSGELCRQSILDIPLQQQESSLGIISLQIQDLQHQGQDVLQTLNLAAGHLSLALSNALQMSRIKDLADVDRLTGLYNRRYFDHRLKLEIKRHQRENQPLGLLFLDIDHFKALNDTYGHQAGDLALQELGRLLTCTLRDTDIAARYGGEEFTLLLPNTNTHQAATLAERLRLEVSSLKFSYQGWELGFTVSIGVSSQKPDASLQGEQLLRLADQALYQAKAQGRNLVCRPDAGTVCQVGS